jgi:hypothetical protein
MLTHREKAYLEMLRKRNFAEQFANQTAPLCKPMNTLERKTRSSIRRKCKMCIDELALAQICGVIPDKEMKEIGMTSPVAAVQMASWKIHLQSNPKLGESIAEEK